MIYCVKCGGASADGAAFCQTCGHRLGDPPAPVQIEATAKRWKLAQLRGVVGIVCGGLLIVGAIELQADALAPSPVPLAVGVVVAVVGLGFWGYGRYGQWWYHE